VNGVNLADIMFSLLCVSLCVCLALTLWHERHGSVFRVTSPLKFTWWIYPLSERLLVFFSEFAIIKKVKENVCYSTPKYRHCHRRGTHQTTSHIPALNLPSHSRYSFTNPKMMEGWVSPNPGCKEQLAHGCYMLVSCRRLAVLTPMTCLYCSVDEQNYYVCDILIFIALFFVVYLFIYDSVGFPADFHICIQRVLQCVGTVVVSTLHTRWK